MKIWQNSVYAPNRPSHGKKGKKRRGGKSFAKLNGKRRASSRKRRTKTKTKSRSRVRANGRTLASYSKKRKSVRRRSHSSGHSLTLANKGAMLPIETMLIAGGGGAAMAGVAIFLGEKYLVPKMTFLDAKAGASAEDVKKAAGYKSAALGALVSGAAGFAAVKLKNKKIKLASLGASIVAFAYALNELFGSQVKDAVTGSKSINGMTVLPPPNGMASINLATAQARALGGMTVQPPAQMGSSIGNDYNKRVW